MKRYFEKISEKQFNKDFTGYNVKYDDLTLPVRKTMHSAAYDFSVPFDFELQPEETIKIPTGIKVKLPTNEFLGIYVRSSMGFKYNVRMCNQVGIVDSDYYNNKDNEGHIWIRLQNEGEKTYKVSKGEGIAQGIFQRYFLVDKDESLNERKGGLGSTN